MPTRIAFAALVTCLAGASAMPFAAPQAAYPAPAQSDFVLKGFHFRSGETLDVKMHYRSYGTLHRNAQGVADNAVLIMHGTGGSSAQFVAANFAGELFGAG